MTRDPSAPHASSPSTSTSPSTVTSTTPTTPRYRRGTFAWLLIGVTLAFVLVLWPIYEAVMWAVIIAMVFQGVNARLERRLHGRGNLAALITLLLVVVIVILPLLTMGASMVQEATRLMGRIQSADDNLATYLERFVAVLPPPVTELMERAGLGDVAAIQRRIGASVGQVSQVIATRLLGIGQDTLNFVVNFFITLYLAFFLLRDGRELVQRITDAIPMDAGHKQDLLGKFVVVTRATVKGNVVVAAVQGLLGGVAFAVLGIRGALLWGVVMAFLSLLPAIGAALVWGPVALYLLFAGQWVQGIGLIVYGVVVIGLVDNVLRPLLVGKDTKMPDYVVLISTVGGMALFGLNGFVLGPLIAAMFIAVWGIVTEANVEAEQAEQAEHVGPMQTPAVPAADATSVPAAAPSSAGPGSESESMPRPGALGRERG